MLKKVLILAGIFLVICACEITPPAEMFSSTPTICVECVQATICAENQSGDECVIELTPSPENALLTETSAENLTEEPVQQGTEEVPATKESEFALPPLDTTPTSTYYLKTPFMLVTIPPEYTHTPKPSHTAEYTLAPTKTSTVNPGTWIYKTQTGSPRYTRNFAHPESGCQWSGVAGQVFGPGGAPQSDVVVIVNGDANGTAVDLMGFTGASVAYGLGAFEVELPTGPVRTYDTIKIQLFDLEGKELSQPYSFDTFEECTKNLTVFNFVSIY